MHRMNTSTLSGAPDAPRLPASVLSTIAAAPHRLLFFVGAANVLLAMAWWALYLANLRWRLVDMPQPSQPPGWLHATLMQYQVLPPFIFGFLLTVFPRWLNVPALRRVHYLPVGLGLFGGQLCTLASLFGHDRLLHLGVVLTIAGWLVGLVWLLRCLWATSVLVWHAVSCAAALVVGLVGLVAFALYLHAPNASLLFASIKLGSFGLLLPIYFTVCHRMVPFFAGAALPGYVAYRPMPALAASWVFAAAHLALELVHAYAALWIVDAPFAALSAWLLYRWWPRRAMPALLRVLFLGYAWLPIALALYAAQSLWFASTGQFALGRAPAHALFIGYFGSLLVAMVTRVTQGHSGRLLALGRVGGFAFLALQLVCVARIVAELVPDAAAWQAAASIGWLLAFLPWVARHAYIYLTPRADGAPG